VLAGRVDVGRREAAAAGVEAAYDLVGAVGERAAVAEAARSLRQLAERAAGQWSVRP
jgi:glycerate kinase